MLNTLQKEKFLPSCCWLQSDDPDRIMNAHMNMRPDRSHRHPSMSPPARQEPLTDRRFEDLLQQASALFAAAERDPEAEKQATIAEIIETMNRYGLTLTDLRATE